MYSEEETIVPCPLSFVPRHLLMSKILVIDDDGVTRLLLKRNLQMQGYHVTLAKNGAEGLHLAAELHPDLIVCDWMMPLVDGVEVCRRIKADPLLATTFFILLTVRGQVDDRIQVLMREPMNFSPNQ